MKALGLICGIGLLAACNGGYSTQESNQICRDELETRMITNNEEVFQQCVLCYEQCSGCKAESTQGSVTFTCPENE